MAQTRRAAARILTRVIVEGQSLTDGLSALETLPAEQRPFVQAACYGVVRWYHRLDFILSRLLHKPIKDKEIKMLALLGLYQLRFMGVKPHAAVSETVSAVGRKQWAKSLLNALLRNYLRRREVLEAEADADPVASVSHPLWMRNKIAEGWPQDSTGIFQANNQQAPMTLRVNLQAVTREEYQQRLKQCGFNATPVAGIDSALVLERPVPVQHLPGFCEGLVSVQDAAAQLAAPLMLLSSAQRVLDVCAAPGGKTVHLLEHCPDLQVVVALDIDEERLQRIQENLNRAGRPMPVELKVADARQISDCWDGKEFDRILLDAPCSGTGVIRRHPDIKLLRRETDIHALARLQREIFEAVWPLLAPGGILLYATCSILKEENERQVSTFLSDYSDAQAVTIQADWGRPAGPGRQILPGENAMDGFYYARLKKCSGAR